jgi:hypothetical protein
MLRLVLADVAGLWPRAWEVPEELPGVLGKVSFFPEKFGLQA